MLTKPILPHIALPELCSTLRLIAAALLINSAICAMTSLYISAAAAANAGQHFALAGALLSVAFLALALQMRSLSTTGVNGKDRALRPTWEALFVPPGYYLIAVGIAVLAPTVLTSIVVSEIPGQFVLIALGILIPTLPAATYLCMRQGYRIARIYYSNPNSLLASDQH